MFARDSIVREQTNEQVKYTGHIYLAFSLNSSRVVSLSHCNNEDHYGNEDICYRFASALTQTDKERYRQMFEILISHLYSGYFGERKWGRM